MYVFQCEDSIDGIFSGVYDAWASRLGHRNIQLSSSPNANYTLFCEYIPVTADFEKSRKVSRTLIQRVGAAFYEDICSCAMADGSLKKLPMDKANAIYQTIVLALACKKGADVLQQLSEPCIFCVFLLRRQTRNEAHHLLEFLRFSELENGILFAQIHPKNDVLPILAPHFANRLPLENFIIYDATHQTAAVHGASKEYLIADARDLPLKRQMQQFSTNEAHFRSLWRAFFDTICVEERKNPKLQIQNIPKRFWADTVELADRI